MALSLRHKLLALVLLPLAVVLPLLGALLLWWGDEAIDRLLLTKVRADLAVAHGYFERVRDEVGTGIAAIARSHLLHLALAGRPAELAPLLARAKAEAGLDFINLRAADGTLRMTETGPAATTDRRSPAFTTVADGAERTSVEVLQPQQLALLSPQLRDRVAVALVPTRNAAPSQRTLEDRALVLLATRAIRSPDGTVLGFVQGGVLLNRNLPFIDHINEIVYPAGSLPFGARGTATLFLDDVRVSTNVRLLGDQRAIGTRVSQQVKDAVLGTGSTWLGRAFVVDDWYVSAYQPLPDSTGRRIGMLYVGMLERPFVLLKHGALAAIGAVFFTVMVGAALVSLRVARSVFAPVERMEATMQRVESGALDARVGPVASGDEIARLAEHLDRLLSTLQCWRTELDDKVAERTRQLEQAQVQLVRSEKLATVGQLTASIAHEVNNPIAVIQGNLDLLRELLPPQMLQRVAPELALVDQQIERMRLIVTQLLQFARPAEYAGYVEALAPRRALDDGLVLVGHLLASSRIALRREDGATRLVAINRQELQQVLVNLLVNAIHALQPGGGTITLSTRDVGDDAVEIAVADSGPGLAPELVDQLFRPFVTRKPDGTGLGLWISRGIVERYGGELRAANRTERGAVFTVKLHAEGRSGPSDPPLA